jgi:hypothetical protein
LTFFFLLLLLFPPHNILSCPNSVLAAFFTLSFHADQRTNHTYPQLPPLRQGLSLSPPLHSMQISLLLRSKLSIKGMESHRNNGRTSFHMSAIAQAS